MGEGGGGGEGGGWGHTGNRGDKGELLRLRTPGERRNTNKQTRARNRIGYFLALAVFGGSCTIEPHVSMKSAHHHHTHDKIGLFRAILSDHGKMADGATYFSPKASPGDQCGYPIFWGGPHPPPPSPTITLPPTPRLGALGLLKWTVVAFRCPFGAPYFARHNSLSLASSGVSRRL